MPEQPTGAFTPRSQEQPPASPTPDSTQDCASPAETGPWTAIAPPPPPAGQRGRFTIERLHAQGGLGQVSGGRRG